MWRPAQSTSAPWARFNSIVLHSVALATAISAFILSAIFVALILSSPDTTRLVRLTVSLGVGAVSLGAFHLARTGRVRAGAVLYVASMAGLLLVPPLALGLGVHAGGIPLLTIPLLVTGLLLSPRASLIFSALSVLMTWGLVWAEQGGWLPNAANLQPGCVLLGSVDTALFTVVGLLTARTAAALHMTANGLASTQAQLQSTIDFQAQTEHQLRAATELAEAASRAKTNFLATISHEIRTPMNGILGMAQLMASGSLPEAQRSECIRTILSSGEVLQALLNDVLDLSRAEAGRFELRPVPFTPATVLADVLALYHPTAQAKGIGLSGRWVSPMRACLGDAVRLRQMLGNLLGNAVRFTDVGSVSLEGEELSANANSVELKFTVRDTGPGIPSKDLSALFQPFSQLDDSPSRSRGGAGLGLSIVAALARQMDGRVGVESEPGRGSSFWFVVRVGLATEASVPASPEQRPSFDASAFRVLIVEDNPVNRRVLEVFLARRKVTYACAENGVLGLEALQGPEVFHLVLMDCQMPVMDGLETTRRIRDLEQRHGRRRLPIIAVTAGASPADRERCLAAGMDDFLSKPVSLQQLDDTLRTWLKPSEGAS